ncbi:MAG: RagB/SusD family nutrient uptake outer membrane protein [Marinilabiliaceae bacterium]|nr:RagB/SusD family nutrient uptake outer membrane protein [Marinilabiliaceae bacterium]
MKAIKNISLIIVSIFFLTSCEDWLTIYPKNAQVKDEYWKSKEDVEAVVISGYYYMREMTIDYLLPWGELRSGAIFDKSGNNLQNFQVKPTDKKNSNWGPLYQVVNIANVVLANAAGVMSVDDTYKEEAMKSHLCEAYFLRALSYFYLVRNWKEVPLITIPNEDDSYSFHIPKASEEEIITQIKSDIKAALATGAAKEYFVTNWETKGRGTRWALYALMADVCLWSEDYETAYEYCNYILNATSPRRPTFMQSPTNASWFSMFNPGNSNESIFEIQWNYQEDQTNKLPVYFDNISVDRKYEISFQLLQDFNKEYATTIENEVEAVRSMFGGYYVSDPLLFDIQTRGYVWKYCGARTYADKRTRTYYDPNFIIYRITEVILMKAEALILRSNGGSEDDWQEAMSLINQVRKRTNLEEIEFTTGLSEEDMLKYLLNERRIEFVGEGKSWYDILRFGRRNNNKYKETFLIQNVLNYNEQVGESWLRSVLNNDYAHFLPIWEDELNVNHALIQNPYYY